jgi:PAS domain S-box-containing protein
VNNPDGTALRVLIAEDEESLRLALCDLVDGEDGLEVVGYAGSAKEAIELAAATKPDVALVDVRMPGGGAEIVGGLKECSPTTRALALSADDDQATVIQMLSAGAVGYVVKGTPSAEILEAVRRAARGQASLSIEAIRKMIGELVGDIAERERAEAGLRRSEERFRALVDSALDAVVILNEEGTIQLVNSNTESLFGYTRDELLGRPIEHLLPERFHERHLGSGADYPPDPTTPPIGPGLDLAGRRGNGSEFPADISLTAVESDRDHLVPVPVPGITERRQTESVRRKNEDRLDALLEWVPDGVITDEGGRIVLVNEQTVGRRRDGSEFPIDIALAEIETDQGRLATAFIRDISERERGEIAARQLAAIVESSDDAIISKDLVGTIETWNLGAERMYGYSAEEVVGRSISLLVPPHLPDDMPGILERVRGGEDVEQFETKRMRKDEVVLDVVLKISAIRGLNGEIVGTSTIARDVSKLRMQGELMRERALLAHLVNAGEEERGRIAEGIHDDSIQAITAAGMRLQILRRSLDDPGQLELLGELEKTIQLSISRLRHLLFELRPPALDTGGLSAALELYLAETQNDGAASHTLVDNLSVQPPLETRTILYRIVQELLANVRKHAEAENATVVVEERDEGYGVRVSDDGIGFAPEELEPVPGHLGLTAMQERAALAGGWLKIDSAPGKGTTVEVWIPSHPVPGAGPSASSGGEAAPNLEGA